MGTSLLQLHFTCSLLTFTSLSISGDSFWAVAIFITSFRCQCVRRLHTFDLLIFITEKACSHCNRCVVILQRCATLQFYQFHLDRLWDLGSVNRERRAKTSSVKTMNRLSNSCLSQESKCAYLYILCCLTG